MQATDLRVLRPLLLCGLPGGLHRGHGPQSGCQTPSDTMVTGACLELAWCQPSQLRRFRQILCGCEQARVWEKSRLVLFAEVATRHARVCTGRMQGGGTSCPLQVALGCQIIVTCCGCHSRIGPCGWMDGCIAPASDSHCGN